ncbi:SAM-dependent methyltransferase [Streptomyces shenzhenensis]|uniref:SAM-dependent methyltransferase n=1 Tax=Streptomyces shenzhenensis TaxID=943815 RepID=UPI0033D1C62E
MREDGFRAEEIDTSRPHPARMDTYPVDRDAGDALAAAAPEVRIGLQANRAFLGRAVRYVVGNGVRQILDIGTGLPTSPKVHEAAQEPAPDVRVAHADNDPIVHTHAGALLGPVVKFPPPASGWEVPPAPRRHARSPEFSEQGDPHSPHRTRARVRPVRGPAPGTPRARSPELSAPLDQGDPHDVAGPALRADGGSLTTGPRRLRCDRRRARGPA